MKDYKWQPIETALKDGTRILVSPGYEEPCDIAWFDPDGGFGDFLHFWEPDHWMPLPKAPDAAMKEAK